MSSVECPPVPSIPPNQIEQRASDGIASVLKALGVESCKATTIGGLSILPPAFAGGTSSIGCEQISAMANAVETHMQQAACIINRQNISSTSRIITSNDVSIRIGSGSRICNITVTQQISGTLTAASSFSTQTQNDVSSVMRNMVEQLGQVAQDQKIGYLGTTDGQRVIQNFTNYLAQDSTVASINDWTQSALTEVVANNKVNILIDPYVIVGVELQSGGCVGGITINQNALSVLQAQTVVNNVLSNIFSSQEGSEYKSNLTAAMTAQAEGADSLISAFSGIIVFVIILVIGGLVVFGRGAISSVVKYILPILIFVSIILAIYFWVRSEYTFMIFAIVALVIFIGLMIYTTFFRKPKIPLSKPIPSQINKTSPPK